MPAHVLAGKGAAEPMGYYQVWLEIFPSGVSPSGVTRALYSDSTVVCSWNVSVP